MTTIRVWRLLQDACTRCVTADASITLTAQHPVDLLDPSIDQRVGSKLAYVILRKSTSGRKCRKKKDITRISHDHLSETLTNEIQFDSCENNFFIHSHLRFSAIIGQIIGQMILEAIASLHISWRKSILWRKESRDFFTEIVILVYVNTIQCFNDMEDQLRHVYTIILSIIWCRKVFKGFRGSALCTSFSCQRNSTICSRNITHFSSWSF